MTLEEAIKHAEELTELSEEWAQMYEKQGDTMGSWSYKECAKNHRQLAEWLKELKKLREQTRWNPVSNGLPKEKETVIVSTEYEDVYPEARYTKKYGWEWAYESGSDYWKKFACVITAWMPLPGPYKEKQILGHCKECKYYERDSVANIDGIPLIIAHEICSMWGDGCKTKEDGYCFMFEPQESEDKKNDSM